MGHLDKTPFEHKIEVVMSRFIYLYEKYVVLNKPLPKTNSKEKFPDGAEITIWLKRIKDDEIINYLLSKKYDYIQDVLSYAGYDKILTKDEILIMRLQYVYEKYINIWWQ